MSKLQQSLNGADWEWCAQSQYETAIVDEARSIVRGAAIKPTAEHLRVLLAWLDTASNATRDDSRLAMPF